MHFRGICPKSTHNMWNSEILLFLQDEQLASQNQDLYFMGYGMDTCLSGDGPLSEAAAMFAGLPPGHVLFDIRRRFVERAKRIDTISRAVFPLSFLVFNVFYWVTYKVLRHEDILHILRP